MNSADPSAISVVRFFMIEDKTLDRARSYGPGLMVL
jgi:hypothetical protein